MTRPRVQPVPGPRRRLRAALPLLLVGLVVTACGSSAAPTTTTRGDAVARTTGCGRPVPARTTTLVVTVHGLARPVVVHAPAGYSATRPTPLVLDLHGSGSTGTIQEAFSGMDGSADRHGFLAAYPRGAVAGAAGGYDWNVPGEPLLGGAPVPADTVDDVAFLTGLVADLGTHYCVDTRRVYVTGFSGGARMASQLACDAAGTFAAVAPVGGLRYPSPCPATRPVPVVAFHGTADPVDPLAGGGQTYWTYPVTVAAARWAEHNGCARSPTTTTVAGVDRTTYRGCAAGATVELYVLPGEGHEWPGGPAVAPGIAAELGPQSDAVAADDVMWDFFASHPLPAGTAQP